MNQSQTRAPALRDRLTQTCRMWAARYPHRAARAKAGRPAVLRFTGPLAVLVIAALMACAGLAYMLAKQADDFIEAEHRQALAGAVEALQAISPDLAQVEPNLIRVLERASGLKDLKFEIEPVGSAREVQSMLDAKGRIVGWFSWQPERPATAMMNRLLPFVASIGVGLIGFATLAMWQLGRLGFQLAKSKQHVQRLEFEDTLTGLPNQSHFFALLDRATADDAVGRVTRVPARR